MRVKYFSQTLGSGGLSESNWVIPSQLLIKESNKPSSGKKLFHVFRKIDNID